VKERFVRLDKSRTLPGSGLGLALVDAVADLHRAEFVMRDGIKPCAVAGTGVSWGTKEVAGGGGATLCWPSSPSLCDRTSAMSCARREISLPTSFSV